MHTPTFQDVRPVTREIISALVKSLSAESVNVRRAAAYVIGSVVKDDVQRREVLPSLLSMLRDRTEKESIRERIIITVAKIAPRLGEVVRALVAVLRDESESEELRRRAAYGVRHIGSWGMHLTPEAPRYGIRALEGYSPTLGGLESASPSGFKFSPRRAATRRNEPQASAPRPPPGDFPRAQAAAVADHKI